MPALLSILWPLFALILGGWLMRRLRFPGEAFWPAAEKLNYYVLLPALLVETLIVAPLHRPSLPRLALVLMVCVAVAWVLLLWLRRRRAWPVADFGVWAQGILRFNSYLGLALVSNLYGAEGMMFAAMVMVLLVPVDNVLAVWSLSHHGTAHTAMAATPATTAAPTAATTTAPAAGPAQAAASAGHSGVSWRELLLPILKNPMVLAAVLSVIANLSGVTLSDGTHRLLSLLAGASLPLGLLCVGAALQFQGLTAQLPALVMNSGARLLGFPLMAWGLAWLVGLPPLETTVLVVFCALPTATSAYILTRQMGGDSTLMAALTTCQTVLAALTLPLLLGLQTLQ